VTEIEQQIANEMALLDAALAAGKLTEAEYDEHVAQLHQWANDECRNTGNGYDLGL
jgi:hypothetical protein